MPTRLPTRRSTTTSISPSVAPSYTTQDPNTVAIELASWNEASSSHHSILSAPPPYTSSPHTFRPTIHLQIQTPGKPWLSLPFPPKPEPIPIFSVNPDDDESLSPEPRYISIRPERSSGSSYLVSGDAYLSNLDGPAKPLSTTTYSFGPGRPPAVSLYLPSQGQEVEEQAPWDTFSILSTRLLSRAQRLQHTRLGTFEWRYASRSERKALKANSVLALERIIRVAIVGGKEEEVRRLVALFVRNEDTRTPGSSASSAGNGGRLMVDLSIWDEEGEGGKTEREMVVVLIVTSAIAMLKKEVDRRRAQQIAIMAGGAGS